MAIWSRLHSFIFGGAIGAAARVAIEPQIEPARQRAWSRNRNRVLDVGTLARLVAQAIVEQAAAVDPAGRTGYSENLLNALVKLEQTAPPVGEAQVLRRRGKINADQLLHAFAKAQIEPQYWEALAELTDDRLDPAVVATAVQRGLMPNEGILPVGPPSSVGDVPPMPVVDLDPFAEAEASGINADRLKVLARIVGLPPAPGELLEMVNRGKIQTADFYRGVAEGNTRNEWAPFLLALADAILPPGVLVNLVLRGHRTEEQVAKAMRAHGYSPEQTHEWWLSAGRPAAPVQMFTAWAREVEGPDGTPMDFAQFEKGIKESDIRNEWTAMLWGIRYAYPPLFQINRLVTEHAATPAEGLDWARKDRLAPEVLAALERFWAGGTGSAGKRETAAELRDEHEGGYISEAELRDGLAQLGYSGVDLEREVSLAAARRAKRWREKVVDAIAKAYLGHAIDEATAVADLAEVQIFGQDAIGLVSLWDLERRVTIHQLTPAQIKKAYVRGILTVEQATAALEAHDYTAEDAGVYLAE